MTERGAPPVRMRADKWLWHARFFKTRSLAAALVKSGRLRRNSERVVKSAQQVAPGDVLTFPQARRIRVVRITALSHRRGPAAEAALLYEDLTPPDRPEREPPTPRKGRPARNDRRAAIRLKTGEGPDCGLE